MLADWQLFPPEGIDFQNIVPIKTESRKTNSVHFSNVLALMSIKKKKKKD